MQAENNNVILRENERIDDLQVNGLHIIQNEKAFRFGCDAVELANFVTGGCRDLAADLGSGSGIIAILLAGKKNIRTVAVEIQPEMAEMSNRSVILNGLEDMVEVVNAPMQEYARRENVGRFSIVVCNPPYRRAGSGEKQLESSIAIARHEITVTLDEVVKNASALLKQGGSFYIVHQCERMGEVISLCVKNRLEPKILQILSPAEGKKPYVFMLKSIKDGKPGLDVLPERVVRTEV